jgi:hypothetical protein
MKECIVHTREELIELPLYNSIDDPHKQNWGENAKTTGQQTDQISTNCHLTRPVICRDNG